MRDVRRAKRSLKPLLPTNKGCATEPEPSTHHCQTDPTVDEKFQAELAFLQSQLDAHLKMGPPCTVQMGQASSAPCHPEETVQEVFSVDGPHLQLEDESDPQVCSTGALIPCVKLSPCS